MCRLCGVIPHTKRICVVTATRAEYGLLKPLIKRLNCHPKVKLMLTVTGTHLAESFGLTRREIEQDGVDIFNKIPILKDSMSATMAEALIRFAVFFDQNNPDAVIILGDRYEAMAVACAATNTRIPIFHIYGGDTTEGAVDEAYRHSITKMSQLHFVSCEDSRKRVIQMGEEPQRVFNVGSLAVENALNENLMSIDELEKDLEISLKNGYAVVTFHSVTLENDTAREQCIELLRALSERTDLSYIITKSNADEGGITINRMLDEYGKNNDNTTVTDSLGMSRYLSALKHARMCIGNSSSGIYEAPIFKIPTVNIGDRQRGRTHAESIINSLPIKDDILKAMQKAENPAFLQSLDYMELPYGDGSASEKIVRAIEENFLNKDIDIKKRFYLIQ